MRALSILAAAAVLVIAGAAGAAPNHHNNTNVNSNHASASSRSTSSSRSSAVGVGVGVGVGKANSGGNTLTATMTNDNDYPASSAIAPGLVANGCMGSSAVAGQGMSVGISLGTTWTDEDCVRIRKAMDLQQAGYATAAMAVRCEDPDVRKAMRYEAKPCPQDVAAAHAAAAAPAPKVASSAPAPAGKEYDRGCYINRSLAVAMGQTCP